MKNLVLYYYYYKRWSLFFPAFGFLVVLVQKAAAIPGRVISPFADNMGIEDFAGKASLSILITLVILLICFIRGLLTRKINERIQRKPGRITFAILS